MGQPSSHYQLNALNLSRYLQVFKTLEAKATSSHHHTDSFRNSDYHSKRLLATAASPSNGEGLRREGPSNEVIPLLPHGLHP